MPRSALAFLLACLSLPAWATDCPQFYAGGTPPAITRPALQPRTQELCFSVYAVMHSGVSRTPLWSAEHLLRANIEAARELVRRNTFHAEPRLPRSERAELSDYARSGYDRGHMAPNGDMPDGVAQEQSFSLANIVPQVHENNAGVWAGIESAVRQLALDEGELYVTSGPAFIGSDIKQIGGRVLVPTHLWKVVYSPTRKQAAAYLITNDATKDYSVLSVAELARFAGIDPLPVLPQKAKDTAMKLPKPIGRGGASARGRPSRAAEDEFSLRDFVRDALERFGAGGRTK